MKINQDILKNEVDGDNQVSELFKLFNKNPKGKKVLFLGNSITLHETAPQIGWNYNWGMAATCEENDYVHQVIKGLDEKFGMVNYCITNAGKWEVEFWSEDVLEKFERSKNYNADIIIIRLGENVSGDRVKEHDFFAQFDKFVKYFKHEGCQLVVTDLFWEQEEIASIIVEVGRKNGAKIVNLGDLGYLDENKAIGKFEHLGVSLHPNDLGMKRIAERILNVIE